MRVQILVLLFVAYASGRPDGSSEFRPSPIYSKPGEDLNKFVADQPAPQQPDSSLSLPAAQPTKPAPVANIRPVEPTNVYGPPDNQVYSQDHQVYPNTYLQPYNGDEYGSYNAHSSYDGYLVPSDGYYNQLATTEGPGLLGYIWSILPHTATVGKLVVKGVKVLFGGVIVILSGAAVVFGICTFTPICSITLSGWSPSTLREEVRSYITPDKISSAAKFVRDAIQKYQEMQKSHEL